MSEFACAVIAGLPYAGKTELSTALVGYGFKSRNIGDELARLVRVEKSLPQSSSVTGLERMPMHRLKRETDPDYFARFCTEELLSHRTVDGLRNLSDARKTLEAGGFVISLIAPRPVRMLRWLEYGDRQKDPDIDSLVLREIQEMDNPDPDSAQAVRVMALADERGFFIDASQPRVKVLEDALNSMKDLGIKL